VQVQVRLKPDATEIRKALSAARERSAARTMPEPLQILVVDDDRAHAEFVRELIRFEVAPDARVEVVTSYSQALTAMAEGSFDVALFDYLLDRGDGLALLREVRAAGSETPVVILTGHGAETTAVDAMKSGAADYLSKATLTAESVGHAIRHAVSIAAAERQRADAERGAVARDDDRAPAALGRRLGGNGLGDQLAGKTDARRVDRDHDRGRQEQDRQEKIKRPHDFKMRSRALANHRAAVAVGVGA